MDFASEKPWIDELCRAERLPDGYATVVFDYVAPLAKRIQALRVFFVRPIVIGINGAQGAGKSTLALFLMNWLQRELGLKVISLSLDDLYLGKQAREDLAKQCHPLLRTRGVPGTHDVARAADTIEALTTDSAVRVVALPGFDKASDDQIRASEIHHVEAPVDVVLFEGWCVGARPQQDEDLAGAVNELEVEGDPDGAWRKYVNEKLKNEYAALFERLDALIMLRVPSFDKVLEWRELQEQKLRDGVGQRGPAGMSPEEIGGFVMHFERLTRHMLEDMPRYADTILDIDKSHQIAAMANKDWPFEVAPP